MHSIIYVMRHIDIGGNVDIPYKKVGITGSGSATLNSRLQQISNTKSPIKAQCIAAWEHSDARAVESALHTLMEDSRVEGEWFLDTEDTLVERMQPIMDLLGAKELPIPDSTDAYTRGILKKESDAKQKTEHILIGEISELLDNPLRFTSRVQGPTFYSNAKELTYYVNARKSGRHNLAIGRTKGLYSEISTFLESHGYEVVADHKGNAMLVGISSEIVAEVINLIEKQFEAI